MGLSLSYYISSDLLGAGHVVGTSYICRMSTFPCLVPRNSLRDSTWIFQILCACSSRLGSPSVFQLLVLTLTTSLSRCVIICLLIWLSYCHLHRSRDCDWFIFVTQKLANALWSRHFINICCMKEWVILLKGHSQEVEAPEFKPGLPSGLLSPHMFHNNSQRWRQRAWPGKLGKIWWVERGQHSKVRWAINILNFITFLPLYLLYFRVS